MPLGLALSLALHVAILVVVLIGLPFSEPEREMAPAVPVRVVGADELTTLAGGEQPNEPEAETPPPAPGPD
ncbi:MAG: hypothetical protein GVY28_09560, partial [Alphaproteobacteria bacterium]|nr:hypothetical protein [Alphaproteobacteria bacterium]